MPQLSSPSRHPRAEIAVVPLKAGERVARRAASPLVLMTVEAAVAQASCQGKTFTLDRAGILVVPERSVVRLSTPAAACRVGVLSVFAPLVTAVAKTYGECGIVVGQLERDLARLDLLPRTVWVHELFHRYLFERCTLGLSDNQATAFLETELLKELHYLFRDRDSGADRTSLVHRQTPCVQRAVAHIEAHPFRPCSVAELAAKVGASQSTLSRAFRRELGLTPGAYWRSRKLDEALVLLRAGGRSVGEVADHVGYENATAFAFAFRSRFGRAPSAFLPRRPLRPGPRVANLEPS